MTGLLANGHSVTALCRSDDKAKKLNEMGVKTVMGTLDDAEAIAKAVQEHEVSQVVPRDC